MLLALQNRALLRGRKGRQGAEKKRGRGVASKSREQELQELKIKQFFLRLFGHPRDIPSKSLVILGFKGHFGPQPCMWKTSTSLEDIRTQKFGFVLLFLPARGAERKKGRARTGQPWLCCLHYLLIATESKTLFSSHLLPAAAIAT